jgi:ankyrin repeat protein
VKVLLAHRADPTAQDSDGLTPMQAAAEKDQNGVVEYLKQAGVKE